MTTWGLRRDALPSHALNRDSALSPRIGKLLRD
jgi:hypothetical protein